MKRSQINKIKQSWAQAAKLNKLANNTPEFAQFVLTKNTARSFLAKYPQYKEILAKEENPTKALQDYKEFCKTYKPTKGEQLLEKGKREWQCAKKLAELATGMGPIAENPRKAHSFLTEYKYHDVLSKRTTQADINTILKIYSAYCEVSSKEISIKTLLDLKKFQKEHKLNIKDLLKAVKLLQELS